MSTKEPEYKVFGILLTSPTKKEWLNVICPYCEAPIGESCGRPHWRRPDETYSEIVITRHPKMSDAHFDRKAKAVGLVKIDNEYRIDPHKFMERWLSKTDDYEFADWALTKWGDRVEKLKP